MKFFIIFPQSPWGTGAGANLFGSDLFSGTGGGSSGTSGGVGSGQTVTTPTDPFSSDPFADDPFGMKGSGGGEEINPFSSDSTDVFGSKGWADSKVSRRFLYASLPVLFTSVLAVLYIPYSAYFSRGNIFVKVFNFSYYVEKISWLRGLPHLFWACARFFVGKYFVVRLSTTKTTKILPPEKYPLYGICMLLLHVSLSLSLSLSLSVSRSL